MIYNLLFQITYSNIHKTYRKHTENIQKHKAYLVFDIVVRVLLFSEF